MNRFSRSISLVALTLIVAACEEDASSQGPAPGSIPTSDVSAEPACPIASGPTIHEAGDVAADETWTAEGSPHLVNGTVNVRLGAKLTIAPCAEVRVAKGYSLNVAYPNTPNQGTLVAVGTERRPIRIVGEGGARWGSLTVREGGSARLAYVTFADGGGGNFQHGASLAVYGDGEDGADPMLSVDHVTIERSLGLGAWLTRGATFGEGSRDLVIRGSGDEADPYPIRIEEHAFDALPTGQYTGNRADEILVEPAGGKLGGSGLLADATLHDRGVPYHIGTSLGHSLRIGGREDGRLVTLTIEAGVTMKFEKGSSLRVQHAQNLKPSTAALRALGTAAKPIVMTSAASAPAPGDWMGLWFGGVPAPTNQIDHVKIAYAGGDCGCILNTCSTIAQHEGAVIFTAPPKTAFITNSLFSQSAGHGITQGFDGAFVDFADTNQFEDLAGCRQTMPRLSASTCPSPRPACDR